MLQDLKKGLWPLVRIIKDNTGINKNEFERRIRYRHRTFWNTPGAEAIRNTPMRADDPIEKWKDVVHWQRKLSNKHNAREFARMHGCRVPDLYWRGKDVSRLNFNGLPEHYVIRPSIGHSCRNVYLMKNSLNLMDKRSYTPDALKEQLTLALAQNPHMEFLVEEFVRDEKGIYRIPDDYKIFLFDGEVALIDVINRISSTTGATSCYDKDWNMLPNTAVKYQQAPSQPPPLCLPEIMTDAKKLSSAYGIFVRIDFYATDNGAVFGEFTPTPSLGKAFPPKEDKLMATYWDQYCPGLI
ncbi:hypothetical protein MKJ04_11950 [Pontibacter sp. E15-1]|uniref:ATP-grasp fold amidoligase family protein n=1 Tax=Pontibacter sp. E15-1 TaxID=2919918 RepID=UPI001F4FD257|nr:ATP-grasp fold amidoligase family protein [Pontibacter sp. E15-1]MCJ8165554.1 hypothetical protein [Pontibacter sp. E15-1]